MAVVPMDNRRGHGGPQRLLDKRRVTDWTDHAPM